MVKRDAVPESIRTELEKRQFDLISAVEVDGFVDKADVVTLPSWPEFMLNDAVANQYWSKLHMEHPDFQFALIDKASGDWIAVGNSIPVHWSESLQALPNEGWDWALRSGMEAENTANMLCALAIQIRPESRRQGLSTLMVEIMKAIGNQHGLPQLIAPVRPNKKSDYPLISMDNYINWEKDGQRFDPWLRIHERLGARIIKVCPQAMHISGSVEQWQQWTGQHFPASGDYIVAGALSPVMIDTRQDRGTYVEANVWMIHD